MKGAFVLLSEPVMPDGEAIVRAFESFASEGERLRVGGGTTDGRLAVVELQLSPHGTAFVALMPMPIPNGEADEVARFSVSSLGTGWTLPAHHAHLVVSFLDADGTGALESLSRLTSVLAAVTQASRAVGVYWGDAEATHDPKFFVETAREPGVVPRITLWTGVSLAGEADGRVSLLSRGMKQLALPDLLLTAPRAKANAALAMFFDLLSYVAERGKALDEGDTVGTSPTERLPVRYEPSPIDPTKQVWRIDLP
jgi:Domain of unknown function (DUF4261)